MTAGSASDWLSTLRLYLAASAGLHLVWESAHLPLYTIWRGGSFGQKAFAVLHCTAGDVMIAGFTLLAALLLLGSRTWPAERAIPVAAAAIVFGVAYAVYSEWVNTRVRHTWAYSDLMPVVPGIGTGLSPILQWLVVPPLALGTAMRRARR